MQMNEIRKTKKTTPRIVIIGAGRVATALALRFHERKIPIEQIFNRSAAAAKSLAEQVHTTWTSEWDMIKNDADWYIIAVRDAAILEVAQRLNLLKINSLVTHTSGATAMAVLQPLFERCGIFYPLQTFSLEKKTVWKKIPICVDATRAGDLFLLQKLAKKIANDAHHVDDQQRVRLHLAAVFANNFTNHCLAIAENILNEANLSKHILDALVQETFEKAIKISPKLAQTGPAQRGDAPTIQRHLALLTEHPERQELYRLLSESIQNMK